MVEDLHPTPELREFDKTCKASLEGKQITLRYLAIDYGTHVGSVFSATDTATGNEIASIPFESHWHKRGRYKLQTGPVKGDAAMADTLGDLAGLLISQELIAVLAQSQKSPDVFDRLEAAADELLKNISGEIKGSG